ncbi:hypothetical protein I4U23_019912 [Adineta vaga]|nr:hypothetical protein I4U23_019912 [Adineta vaga]
MSLLTSLIDKFTLSCTKDNQIGDHDDDLYNLIFDYYISPDAVEHFTQAIHQLDSTSSLEENYQWFLFIGFNAAMDIGYYDGKHRDILCHFWLPIYEVLLNEFIENLSFNAIKYILSNLIRMQITIESLAENFMKQELQFRNLNQKNEYLSIIKILLPLLINENFLQNLQNDNYSTIDLRWDANTYSNTQEITSTYISWILLKLLLMFIKTDGNCFTMIKHDLYITNNLCQSIRLVDDQHPIKLSLYIILALVINENEIQDFKDILPVLVDHIKKINYLNGNISSFSNNGVYDIDLLIALKGCLQYDQMKAIFLKNDDFNLLIALIDPLFLSTEIESEENNIFSELSKSLMDLTPEDESDPDQSQVVSEMKTNVKNGLKNLLKDMAFVALECLYLISFNQEAKEKLQNLIESLSLIRDMDIHDSMKKIIDGLLWKLEQKDDVQNEQENNLFDLMISYNEDDDKSAALKVYNYIKDHFHYRISFDDYLISTSSICQAIRNSRCILLCISETYKTNPNCRLQAEYAHDRKKQLIPFLLKQTRLDGWLGSICENRSSINSIEEEFEKVMETVTNESQQETLAAFFTSPESEVRMTSTSNDYKTIPIESWTDQHVQHFLYDNKLDIMVLLTEHMNGEELYQLVDKCQSEQGYWMMFDRFNQELEKRFHQVLPISIYVRFLNQIRRYITVSMF